MNTPKFVRMINATLALSVGAIGLLVGRTGIKNAYAVDPPVDTSVCPTSISAGNLSTCVDGFYDDGTEFHANGVPPTGPVSMNTGTDIGAPYNICNGAQRNGEPYCCQYQAVNRICTYESASFDYNSGFTANLNGGGLYKTCMTTAQGIGNCVYY